MIFFNDSLFKTFKRIAFKNIYNFTVTFSQFNASLLNKRVNKNIDPKLSVWKIYHLKMEPFTFIFENDIHINYNFFHICINFSNHNAFLYY